MNYLANEALPKSVPAIVCHGPEDYRLEEWKVLCPTAESCQDKRLLQHQSM